MRVLMEPCQPDSQAPLPLSPCPSCSDPKNQGFSRTRNSAQLLPLICSELKAAPRKSDLPKTARFICVYPWCDDLESPRWKVRWRNGKMGFFKCWGCLEGGGGLCMAMPAWGVQSGLPSGHFLGFLLFQICINGPLKEAKLLKTADNEKGGGER